MKVLAINGSPRLNGNTDELIKTVFTALEAEGIETECIQIGAKNIKGCIACYKCFENKDKKCAVKNDIANEVITKILEADGLILASPTYFTDITAELKALIDRLGLVAIANGGLLRHKVGAAVIAVRRGGGIHAFDTINHLFQISQMFIVGSTYWNLGFGRNKGEVLGDDEGLKNMTNLGQSMAFLLKKLDAKDI
ncbi:MAG: flavodoxin family protein [Candidatus Omnitrophica bacterium]|nr:flavodoxin family protein [Candidatus Omnitrophota bacterium]